MKRLIILAVLLIMVPAAIAQLTPDIHQFYGNVNGAHPGDRIDVTLDPPIAMPIFTYVDANNQYGYNPLFLIYVGATGIQASFAINGTVVGQSPLQPYAITHLDLTYAPGIPSHCTNGAFDAVLGETDVDCGGPCPRCQVYYNCSIDADCVSGLCVNGMCYPGHCDNSVFEALLGETDLDCGGTCPPCANGQDCYNDTDCTSGNCVNGTCQAPPTPANTCSNHIKDVNETDVDCGGNCPKCGNGQTCLVNGDCRSGWCKNGLCTRRVSGGGGGGGGGGGAYTPWMPTVGTEAGDVMCAGTWQCGEWGACQPDSTMKRTCTFVKEDPEQLCTLRPAAPGQVQACAYTAPKRASCYDGVQNQGETGIDCGGPCQPCYVPIEVPKEAPAKTPWIILGAVLIAIIIGVVAWMALKPPKVSGAASYVKSALSRGFTQQDIAKKMKQAGYTPAQIKSAMKK
ncbi:hypothetical protein KY329_01760 [Candidatus Woesearchaeota archaeon]|nr:hypothetical protein [Candidatus Woesearchaeota archaeon]